MSLPHGMTCGGSIEVDVLVLGGGLAGTRAALAARQRGVKVLQVYMARGASPFVIGANVPLGAVDPADSAEHFSADMLDGGYGLGDRRLVDAFAQQAVPAFEDLVRLGVPFERNADGYLQRHLSGNSFPRSVYVAQGTGRAVLDVLDQRAREAGVIVWPGHQVATLLACENGVGGAIVLKRHATDLMTVKARATILAMGGVGRIYGDSTYPADVSGDAAVLALEAGAQLVDMEFVQFEPVVTLSPEGARGMEMPTAMLGDGAALRNASGERFMFRYNPEHGERKIEKARMALCIQQEIDEGRGLEGGTVLFDTTTVPPEKLEAYVSHCKRLRQCGLDPLQQGPLVRPAAHSIMGGIHIDETGSAGVPGLYACGEASGGIHGASRIAGNGGGETLAMGWIVGRAAAQAVLSGTASKQAINDIKRPLESLFRGGALSMDSIAGLKDDIRKTMDETAGLYRTASALQDGLRRIDAIAAAADELAIADPASALAARGCRNMALISRIILRAALMRTESRGAHQRRDYPAQDDGNWRRHIVCRLDDGGAPILDTQAVQ